jgi:tetratricopeptide (TPR) repeat protein
LRPLTLGRSFVGSLGLAVALVFVLGVARADEVILKDGSVVRGEVLAGDAKAPLKVRVTRDKSDIVVEIPRDDVRWVRRLGDDAARQLARVEALLVDGKVARAIEALQAFVKQRPKDARAQRELGFALLLANDAPKAVKALELACTLDPLDLEAHLTLARAQLGLAQRDAAIETLRRACHLGPGHAETFRRLALLLLHRHQARAERLADGSKAADRAAAYKDRLEALRVFERALRIDDRHEGVVLEFAAALLRGPEADRQRAGKVLMDFLRKTPQAAGAVRMLAQLEAAQGSPKKALLRIVGLLKQRGLPPPLRERLEAEAALYGWLKAGATTLAPPGMDAGQSKVDLRRARLRLVFLLELLPEDGRLMLALARVELRDGELDEGRAWLDRAALSGPLAVQGAAGLLQQVCVALLRSKLLPNAKPQRRFFGPKVAVAKARKLVALAPWLAAAHRTLGAALEREAKFKAAAQAYAEGIPWSRAADKESLIKAAESALGKAKRAQKHKDL